MSERQRRWLAKTSPEWRRKDAERVRDLRRMVSWVRREEKAYDDLELRALLDRGHFMKMAVREMMNAYLTIDPETMPRD